MKKSTFIFNLLATTAMATGAKAAVLSGDGWSYDEDSHVLSITDDRYQNIAYPEEWIGDDWRGNVYSIKFGPDVTRVVQFSGLDYNNVTSVSFNKNATVEIDDGAFSGLSSLSFVSLPNNALLGSNLFSGYGISALDVGTGINPNSQFDLSDFNLYCSGEGCSGSFDNGATEYERDDDGVYIAVSSGTMFASAENMMRGLYSGDSSYACATHDECVALVDPADLLTSNGGSNGGNGGSGGSVNNNSGSQSEPKRIYTLEEARQAVEAAGTDTVNVRIRYK
ncbi:MAG: hypothetical protein J6X42_04080 [Alphaproteobacteria bacterium]|nr:hypothetical protein [Alphaproteobacteria bacterium]